MPTVKGHLGCGALIAGCAHMGLDDAIGKYVVGFQIDRSARMHWQVQLPFAGVDFDDALLAMVCLLHCGDVCAVLLCVVVAAAVFLLFAMVARCYVG